MDLENIVALALRRSGVLSKDDQARALSELRGIARVADAAADVVARRARARAAVPWSLDEGLKQLSQAVTDLAETRQAGEG